MLDASLDELGRLAAAGDGTWAAADVSDAVERVAVTAGLVNAEGRPQMAKAQAPIRVATTGRSVGPPLWESLAVLGPVRTLARLGAARERLG